MTNINLNLYKIFCTVANSKSYSEASEKINVSVPNISTQILNLENQLDTKLFNREKDGVKLTESGKELYEIVSKSMLAFEYGEKVLKEKNDLSNGTITIGCPSHITTYYLMDCIEKAKKEHPRLIVRLISSANTDKMLELLENHEIDFMIMDIIPNSNIDLSIEELKSVNNIFVSKKPLKINDVKELENLKYILNFDYTNTTKKLMETLNKYDVKIKDTIECDVTEVRVDAAKRELGIGYVMKEAVKRELENGDLYEVELPIELPNISINLIHIKNQLTRVDKSFIKNLLSVKYDKIRILSILQNFDKK